MAVKKRAAIVVLIFLTILPKAKAEEGLMPERTRLALFDKVVAEIERTDGEALPIRKNRPETWKETVAKLRVQVAKAQSNVDLGLVFLKLDATYPNLHARMTLNEKYDLLAGRTRPQIAVRFGVEEASLKQKEFSYRIRSIDSDLLKGMKESVRPAVGDYLTAINGRTMKEWSRENFIFCKFPLRAQCEFNIFDSFRKAFLSWDWRSPLEYTLKRNDREWSVKIPVLLPSEPPQPAKESAKDVAKVQTPAASVDPNEGCPVEADRYAGFRPVYKGLNICVYESKDHPNVVVLRLASFQYRANAKGTKTESLQAEVDQFYDGFWKAKAPTTKKLIIDVLDNGGGDTPVAWYKIFYNKPFQEEYVQFKKTPEFENATIRKELFYDDGSKEVWLNDLKKSGQYQKIKMGEFLPPVPQFCAANEDESCAKGLYTPLDNGFKGEIRVMVNEWCISSCTGFVWSLKDQLAKRVKVIGVPDSGDSAYARLFLDAYPDEKNSEGFRLELLGRVGRTSQKLPEGAIFRHQITATRSTDKSGKIVSATPTKVDQWISYRYRHYEDTWEADVFKAALAK